LKTLVYQTGKISK